MVTLSEQADVLSRSTEAVTLDVPAVSWHGLAAAINEGAKLLRLAESTRPRSVRGNYREGMLVPANGQFLGRVATTVHVLDAVLPRSSALLPEKRAEQSWRTVIEAAAKTIRPVSPEVLGPNLPPLDIMGLFQQIDTYAKLHNHDGPESGAHVAASARTLDTLLPYPDQGTGSPGIDRWFDVIQAVAQGATLKPGETDVVFFLIPPAPMVPSP